MRRRESNVIRASLLGVFHACIGLIGRGGMHMLATGRWAKGWHESMVAHSGRCDARRRHVGAAAIAFGRAGLAEWVAGHDEGMENPCEVQLREQPLQPAEGPSNLDPEFLCPAAGRMIAGFLPL